MTIQESLIEAAAGRKLLAWSPIGSQLYGLATPTSDQDFAALVAGRKYSRQLISGDLDMRFYTPDMLLELLFDARISEVDMLMAGKLQYTANEYSDLFQAFRFNSNKYFKNADSFAFKQAEYIAKHPDMTQRRTYKALKAATRVLFLGYRALEQGETFSPIFTAEQAARYWASLETLQAQLQEPRDQQEIMALIYEQARAAEDSSY